MKLKGSNQRMKSIRMRKETEMMEDKKGTQVRKEGTTQRRKKARRKTSEIEERRNEGRRKSGHSEYMKGNK